MAENHIVRFGGQFETLQQGRARLAIVGPTARALIFVLVFLAFNSVLTLWLRGMSFSMTAAAMLNGLMVIAYFSQLREEGESVRDSVKAQKATEADVKKMDGAIATLKAAFQPGELKK